MTTPLARTLVSTDVGVGEWTLDPARTTVRITHKTLWGLMTVKGTFTDVTGRGTITADHAVTGTVVVAAASVDTGNAKRDHHLRGDGFFDADNHPSFELAVHSVVPADAGHLELQGELTVKGVREPVTLSGEVTGLDAVTVAVHVTGSVDRHRFGVSSNQLGMIRGLTGLDVDAVFTRAA